MKNLLYYLLVCTILISCEIVKDQTQSSQLPINFRDLNKNGKLDDYEDATKPTEIRVADLLSQMTVAEKAGLLFNSDIGLVGEPPLEAYLSQVDSLKINHMGMSGLATAKAVMDLNNAVQKLAENSRLGIPVTWYTDPRNGLRYNEAAGENRYHARFPSDLGFAATRDPQLVRDCHEIAKQEYLALGIKLALHPMADLATEPRWFRNFNTYGEDAELAAKMVKEHILGFQGEELGKESVICQVKHFPGAGPQKNGMDAHFATGKEQNYRGGNFDYHLIPFVKGAFAANVAQVMPYYGMPVGTKYEEVGFSFNKGIITDLLRDSLGFDGVVCTDWSLITDNFAKAASAWGVEELSRKERVLRVLNAGVDMFGGEKCPDLIIELVEEGSLTEERLDESVRRVLHDKFKVGLFDNPYLSEEDLAVFENKDFKEKGKEAQRKALTLLKNEDNILPLPVGKKVFLEGVDPKAVAGFATVVDKPEDADVILLKFNAPYTPITEGRLLEKIFHQGRLDFPEDKKQELLKLINTKPTVTIMNINRPAIIPDINAASKALIADFECEDEIIAELIFGKFKPTGKLPIEIPSSVKAVEEQMEDTPYDSKDPLYPYGFGLAYNKQEMKTGSIEIDGNNREFEYYAPATFKTAPSLVFVLHGSRGTMYDARWQTNYEFERLAAERGNQIVVYPQGYDQHWNDCRGSASYKANQEDINDIAFFAEMIDYFNKKFQINQEAVFVTGISNGGHMCYKLGYELPNKFKGIAPFVANLPESANNDCTPKNEAVSMLIINGTKDPINPYDGGWVVLGQDSTRGAVQSTKNTVDYWRNLLNCEPSVEKVEYEDYCKEDGSTVTHYKFTCATSSKKVELIKVFEGGHVVPVKDTPDLPAQAKKFIGNKNRDINAPLLVLDFFESLIEKKS